MLKFQIGIQACFTTITYWSRFLSLKYRWKEFFTDMILSEYENYCSFSSSLHCNSFVRGWPRQNAQNDFYSWTKLSKRAQRRLVKLWVRRLISLRRVLVIVCILLWPCLCFFCYTDDFTAKSTFLHLYRPVPLKGLRRNSKQVCKKKKEKKKKKLRINIDNQNHKWACAWQNQQIDLCAQRKLRSAWASAQSDQSLRYPHEESFGS